MLKNAKKKVALEMALAGKSAEEILMESGVKTFVGVVLALYWESLDRNELIRVDNLNANTEKLVKKAFKKAEEFVKAEMDAGTVYDDYDAVVLETARQVIVTLKENVKKKIKEKEFVKADRIANMAKKKAETQKRNDIRMNIKELKEKIFIEQKLIDDANFMLNSDDGNMVEIKKVKKLAMDRKRTAMNRLETLKTELAEMTPKKVFQITENIVNA